MKTKTVENIVNEQCLSYDDEDTGDFGFDEVDDNFCEVRTSLHEALYDFEKFSKELYDINCMIESSQPVDDKKIMEMIERTEQLDLYSEEIVMYTNNLRESINNFLDNISNK